jgi:hypothetical protein
MIKMKMGEILLARAALTELENIDLPAKASLQIARLMRACQAEYDLFERQRMKALKELGEERDATPTEEAMGLKGRVMSVLTQNEVEFHRRMMELQEEEAEIVVSPVSVTAFGETSIKPKLFAQLGPLVKD